MSQIGDPQRVEIWIPVHNPCEPEPSQEPQPLPIEEPSELPEEVPA